MPGFFFFYNLQYKSIFFTAWWIMLLGKFGSISDILCLYSQSCEIFTKLPLIWNICCCQFLWEFSPFSYHQFPHLCRKLAFTKFFWLHIWNLSYSIKFLLNYFFCNPFTFNLDITSGIITFCLSIALLFVSNSLLQLFSL